MESRTLRAAAAIVVAVAVFLTAGGVRADEQADLDKGRNAYLARQYDEADARFRAMLDPRTGTLHDPVLVTQAYMYWGAVMVAKRRPDDAGKLFEQLLLKDPHYEPDALSFPTEVLDAFSDTRNRIRERLNAAAREAAQREAERRAREEQERRRQVERVRLLERLATEEKVTEKHSRLVALVPFGAGQFQNGQSFLGWLFLGTEVVCVAVGTIAVPFYLSELQASRDANNDAASPTQTRDSLQHTANAQTWRAVNLVSYGAFAVTALAGIVQANVKFEPEIVVVKKRAVPAAFELRLSPGGLGGTF